MIDLPRRSRLPRWLLTLSLLGAMPFCAQASPYTVTFVSGVHDADRNVAYRSTVVVDRDGLLRWGQAGDRQMIREGSEILRVLDVIARLRG